MMAAAVAMVAASAWGPSPLGMQWALALPAELANTTLGDVGVLYHGYSFVRYFGEGVANSARRREGLGTSSPTSDPVPVYDRPGGVTPCLLTKRALHLDCAAPRPGHR